MLCLGVVRPYKGVEVLLDAFRTVADDAELWVVGRPLGVSIDELRARAGAARVRFVPRYVGDRELPALLRRADVLALPHLNVDVSGVLFAGLAFGKAMAALGRRRLRRAGARARDRPARPARRRRGAGRPRSASCWRDPEERAALEQAARAAAAGPVLVGPDRRADAGAVPGSGRVTA